MLKLSSVPMPILSNFKIICSKHSMYCKEKVGKDSE